jgi:PAS domain S-box-containing protein
VIGVFQRSLRARLTAAIMAGTLVSSLVLLSVMLTMELVAGRRELLQRTEVAAHLVAEHCVPPLAFDDLDGAARVLSRLDSIPAISAARLVDTRGGVVAAWTRQGEPAVNGDQPAAGGHRFGAGTLDLAVAVTHEEVRYGTLQLRASAMELRQRLTSSLWTTALALLGVLLISWVVARRLQRRISGPILDLAATMQRVSAEQDFTLRTTVTGSDEVTALGHGLNQMLAQIEARRHEREQDEERVARMAAAVEHAGESVVITDILGVVQYVNPAFTRSSGYTAEEAAGARLDELQGVVNATGQAGEMWRTVHAGASWSGRLDGRRKDGSWVVEDATLSPIRAPGGEILGFVAVKRDVTQQVRLEGQLHQAQRMEALGTLAGGIAHDFNNILTGIMGYAELARSEVPPGSDLEASLAEVVKGGTRAAGLVRQILTFSRRTEEERRPVKVALVVVEALKLLRASLPSTIEFRQEVESEASVLTSPTQVHQVVMNLCTNAGLAMKERGGVLTVELRDKEIVEAQARELPGLSLGPHVCLSVTDTGVGIPPAVRDRIFEPFFTTRTTGEGTGLGLSVVHGIVTALHGAITVYSEPGQGATFRVYLPRCDAAAAEARGPAAPRGGRERVLVVDDEPALVSLGQRLLGRLGYRVTGLTSSREALALVRADPSAFDLVITDLTMPPPTGLELAEALRDLRPGLPVVLCTGFGDAVTADRAANLGITATAHKPFTSEGLAAVVRAALDRRPPR